MKTAKQCSVIIPKGPDVDGKMIQCTGKVIPYSDRCEEHFFVKNGYSLEVKTYLILVQILEKLSK